jgi:hypothetical protein
MSRDSNRFKLDPTIVALNSQTAGQNYGHAISQAFKDIGDIENNKINLQLADTKNQYEEIKLNSIKDELDDDRTYKNYILAEDKEVTVDDNIKNGIIIEQDKVKGTKLEKDDTIVLKVAKLIVVYPDFVLENYSLLTR